MNPEPAYKMERVWSRLARFCEWVADNLGLYLPETRWPELEKRIAQMAAQSGCRDGEGYLDLLLSSSPDPALISDWARILTVGETYFFRDAKVFRALEENVIPALIRSRRASGKRLRFWSAGCCTGEEAYSLAILLAKLLPDWNDWDISILATDINPDFLDKARKGVYGKWSFRDTPAWVRSGFFRQHSGAAWEVLPEIKSRVTFGVCNLAEAKPFLPMVGMDRDLVFCRNVLMYFTPERMRAAIRNLASATGPEGRLIVSPIEASREFHPFFMPEEIGGALFYGKRKPASAASLSVPAGVREPGQQAASDRALPAARESRGRPAPAPQETVPLLDAARAVYREGRYQDAIDLVRGFPPETGGHSAALALAARALANLGRHQEALPVCRLAMDSDRFNPGLLYLLSLIFQELGNYPGAADALNKALYLEPGFVLAHYGLGSLALRRGSAAEASRHFRNTLALLRSLAADALVPESDGMTAGKLKAIIMESLPGKDAYGR